MEIKFQITPRVIIARILGGIACFLLMGFILLFIQGILPLIIAFYLGVNLYRLIVSKIEKKPFVRYSPKDIILWSKKKDKDNLN